MPTASSLKYAKLGYFILVSFLAAIVIEFVQSILDLNLVHMLGVVSVAFASLTVYLKSRPRPVYLVDFSCAKPPARFRISSSTFIEHVKLIHSDDEKTIEFLSRFLDKSSVGEETCVPPACLALPPRSCIADARAEAELLVFMAIDDLFEKTGLDPADIDILVVNGAMFAPMPSLSAMIVNKYKLRSDIRSFNISGMGCSAGLCSVGLVRDLLQVHPNCNALVVSSDTISQHHYPGKKKAMMFPNCVFRMGSTAIFLTNRASERCRSKYQLRHLVRTNKSADDSAYRCVFQEADEDGHTGIFTSKDIVSVLGDTFRLNMKTMGSLALPLSEKLMFLFNLISRSLINPNLKPYVPDFKQAFEHFCIHVGGPGVIDEVQKNLRLSKVDAEPSRMTLHRFGNTSTSTIWYELSYIEAKGRMRRGDRAWQISFGSGFKCNSAVWKCLRTVTTPMRGPWGDCISRYPVELAKRLNDCGSSNSFDVES